MTFRVQYGDRVYDASIALIDCKLLQDMHEEGNDLIQLDMYEDVFCVLNRTDQDWKSIVDHMDKIHLANGLSYFNSEKALKSYFRFIETGKIVEFYTRNRKYLSKNQISFKTLPLELLKKLAPYLDFDDWKELFPNPKIPISFFREHYFDIPWETNRHLTSFEHTLTKKYRDIVFTDDEKTYLMISEIQGFYTFRPELMELYEKITINNRVFVESLLSCSKTPESLIEKYISENRVCWKSISSNEGLSLSFLEKYSYNVVLAILAKNKRIPASFFIENHFSLDQHHLFSNFLDRKPSEEDMITFYDAIKGHICKGEIEWIVCEIKPKLPEKIISDFRKKLNLPESAKELFERYYYNDPDECDERDYCHLIMPDSFWEGMVNSPKINWNLLCENRYISEDFWKRHIKKVNWPVLVGNLSISLEFLETGLEKAKYQNSLSRRKLPDSFIDRHIDELQLEVVVQNCSNYMALKIYNYMIREKGVFQMRNTCFLSRDWSIDENDYVKYLYSYLQT